MSLVKNTVIALIIVITTSAGAVAGYFIGMKQENRRMNELLRDTHTQLTGVIQEDDTADSDAIRYRQQGALQVPQGPGLDHPPDDLHAVDLVTVHGRADEQCRPLTPAV